MANVRFGSLADMRPGQTNVRFTPESGHLRHRLKCLLSAKSGHRAFCGSIGRLLASFMVILPTEDGKDGQHSPHDQHPMLNGHTVSTGTRTVDMIGCRCGAPAFLVARVRCAEPNDPQAYFLFLAGGESPPASFTTSGVIGGIQAGYIGNLTAVGSSVSKQISIGQA